MRDPGNEVVSGIHWIQRFEISTVSLYPKIGNIRRFVPCERSLLPKDSLSGVPCIHRFVISPISLHPKVCTMRMFTISDVFATSEVLWIQRFAISVCIFPTYEEW